MDPATSLAACIVSNVTSRNVDEFATDFGNEMMFDQACVESTLNYFWSEARRFGDVEYIVFSTLYSTLTLLAVIGNLMVIYAVLRTHHMRASNRNVFILNMAVANFLLALCVVPLLWMPVQTFHFPYGSFGCKAANALPASNIYCSTLTISAMSVDRYYSVLNVTQHDRESRKRLLKLAGIAILIWLTSFVLSTPLIFSYNIESRVLLNQTITVYPSLQPKDYTIDMCKMSNSTFLKYSVTLLQVLFLYLIPMLVLGLFNQRLSSYLNERERTMRSYAVAAASARPSLTPAIGESKSMVSITVEEVGKKSFMKRSTSKMHTTSSHQSMANIRGVSVSENKRSSRNQRATNLLTAMALSYGVLWAPFTVMTLLDDFGFHSETFLTIPWYFIDEIGKLISLTSLCINPLLYGFLNSNFQQEFRDIVHSITANKGSNGQSAKDTNRSISHVQMKSTKTTTSEYSPRPTDHSLHSITNQNHAPLSQICTKSVPIGNNDYLDVRPRNRSQATDHKCSAHKQNDRKPTAPDKELTPMINT